MNSSISSFLTREGTPVDGKRERKRALTNAVYYTECYLNGILPMDADRAAVDAHSQYDKWWVQTSYKYQNSCNSNQEDLPKSQKRQRTDAVSVASVDYLTPTNSSQDANIATDDEITVDKNEVQLNPNRNNENMSIREVSTIARYSTNDILACKIAALEDLRATGGDTMSIAFRSYLHILSTSYSSRGWDARWGYSSSNSNTNNRSSRVVDMDGTWLTLSKPNYTDCQGTTDKGDCLYALGRLSFDMFRPTGLKCSIQGIYNTISLRKEDRFTIVCPTKLQSELLAKQANAPAVRNYDIIVAITIVSGQDKFGSDTNSGSSPDSHTTIVKRPIRAFLTNRGHCIPDPNVPNRITIWFTGGTLEIQDEDADITEWKQLFDRKSRPNLSIREYAGILAAKFILGAQINDTMDIDGSMHYSLKRPIGGHGNAFVDVLYSDDSMRIVRGHNGAIYVFNRVPTIDT